MSNTDYRHLGNRAAQLLLNTNRSVATSTLDKMNRFAVLILCIGTIIVINSIID